MKRRIHTSTKKLLSIFVITLLGHSVLPAQPIFEQPLTGVENGVGFLLSWTTVKDDETAFFVVERSESGLVYKAVGSVARKPTKGIAYYEFKDNDLGLSTAHYRLNIVTPDGGNSYTRPILLRKEHICNFAITHQSMLTPEVAQVIINSVNEGEIKYHIKNKGGEILLEETKLLEIGLNDFSFDLSNEPDGTYEITFQQKNVIDMATIKKETKEKKGNMADTKSKKTGG